jgi:hypothetical protein
MCRLGPMLTPDPRSGITATKSDSDPLMRLCVVTGALSATPAPKIWRASEVRKQLSLAPISFHATAL